MADIVASEVADEIAFYLPDNTLSETNTIKLVNLSIDSIGTDESYFDQVLCDSIRRTIIMNKNNFTTTGSNLKKFKYGKTEEEYNTNITNPWETKLKNLPEICATFNYAYTKESTSNTTVKGGLYISPGDDIDLFEDYEDTEGYPY